jgi:hypothetical protein
MCAGIRDAANLAWKLDLVLRDRAPEALLDSYQEERSPSAQRAIEFSMKLGKVICVPDRAEAAARDEAMAASVGPEPVEAPALPGLDHGLIHRTSPNAGRLFVQGKVHGRWFDDAHGAGWRLVTVDIDAGSINASAREWFESIGGRIVPLPHPDPTYCRWFTDHDTTCALQRPDFYLYGTATTAAGASMLLEDLRRQLSSAHNAQGGFA